MEAVFGYEDVIVAGPVYDGTCARQSFSSHGTLLRSVYVLFSYEKHQENDIISVDVLDFLTRRKIASAGGEGVFIQGEMWCDFPVMAETVVGKKYDLMVRTQNTRCGFCPTVFCGRKSHVGDLFIGSKLVRGMELTCKMEY